MEDGETKVKTIGKSGLIAPPIQASVRIVCIVEGPSCCAAGMSLPGRPDDVIFVSGACGSGESTLRGEHARFLCATGAKIVVIGDADEAGERGVCGYDERGQHFPGWLEEIANVAGEVVHMRLPFRVKRSGEDGPKDFRDLVNGRTDDDPSDAKLDPARRLTWADVEKLIESSSIAKKGDRVESLKAEGDSATPVDANGESPQPDQKKEGKKDQANSIEPAEMGEYFVTRSQVAGIGRLRFHRGSYHFWRDGRFVEMDTSEVKADLIRLINCDYCNLTTGIVANVMQQVQAHAILPSSIDPPFWINNAAPVPWPAREVMVTRSQLIHIPSLGTEACSAIPASPLFFSRTALDFDFDPNAAKPQLWLDFLKQLWGDDTESIRALREWFGYMLTCDTRMQKILLLIGPPRCGKGTIARILRALIGEENVCGPKLASFAGDFGLAPLVGKSAAIISDARIDGRVDVQQIVETLLTVSGEDVVTVPLKHRDSITCRIPARIMIMSNLLPELPDQSGALAKRMIVLKLRESFLGREDHELTDKLLQELPGILVWSIKGWQDLQKRKRFLQPASSSGMAEDLHELTSPVLMFVNECCELGAGYEQLMSEIYDAYRDWGQRNGRTRHTHLQSFGRMLRAAVPGLGDSRPRDADGKRTRVYEGIKLRPGF
jgi:P4 family phage/plasmid primase-like protien